MKKTCQATLDTFKYKLRSFFSCVVENVKATATSPQLKGAGQFSSVEASLLDFDMSWPLPLPCHTDKIIKMARAAATMALVTITLFWKYSSIRCKRLHTHKFYLEIYVAWIKHQKPFFNSYIFMLNVEMCPTVKELTICNLWTTFAWPWLTRRRAVRLRPSLHSSYLKRISKVEILQTYSQNKDSACQINIKIGLRLNGNVIMCVILFPSLSPCFLCYNLVT